MRILAIILAAAAVGSLAVSLASRQQSAADVEWTMYTPLSNEAKYDMYDGMRWNDARLWLGLAIGFGVAAAAAGITSSRRSS